MSKLRVYTVHVDPALQHPYEEAKFIKEGFSWGAFAFTGFWALYNRLWLHAIAIFLVNGLLYYLTLSGSNPAGFSIAELGWRLIIGYLANDFLRSSLKNRGFLIADIVTGDSELRAEQRFFDRYFSGRTNLPAFTA